MFSSFSSRNDTACSIISVLVGLSNKLKNLFENPKNVDWSLVLASTLIEYITKWIFELFMCFLTFLETAFIKCERQI